MNIKARIAKLEHHQPQTSIPKVERIIVNVGETEEQAVCRWMLETDKPRPEAIIFRVMYRVKNQ